MKDLARLAELLREARRRLDLSRTEAARRAGISVSHMWVLEGGNNPKTGKQSTPSFGLCLRLAKVLNLDAVAILDTAGYSADLSSVDKRRRRTDLEILKMRGPGVYAAPLPEESLEYQDPKALELAGGILDRLSNGTPLLKANRKALADLVVEHATALLRLVAALEGSSKDR